MFATSSLTQHALTPIRVYHGSDVAIEQPDVTRNTGFADLGQGFYLTDNHDAACGRARTRARRMGARAGVVSIFDLDIARVPWVTWGAEGPETPQAGLAAEVPFGLRFDESR